MISHTIFSPFHFCGFGVLIFLKWKFLMPVNNNLGNFPIPPSRVSSNLPHCQHLFNCSNRVHVCMCWGWEVQAVPLPLHFSTLSFVQLPASCFHLKGAFHVARLSCHTWRGRRKWGRSTRTGWWRKLRTEDNVWIEVKQDVLRGSLHSSFHPFCHLNGTRYFSHHLALSKNISIC